MNNFLVNSTYGTDIHIVANQECVFHFLHSTLYYIDVIAALFEVKFNYFEFKHTKFNAFCIKVSIFCGFIYIFKITL